MDTSASTVAEVGVEIGANVGSLEGAHLESEPSTAAPPAAKVANEFSDEVTAGGNEKIVSGEDSTSEKPPQGDDPAVPGGSRTHRKRKRARRNRRNKKKYVPYNKLSWQERRERDERETRRANKIREKMFLSGQPVAPYNTTQFLIEDHNESIDIDAQPRQLPRHKRARDSSFSYDSDEDFYYSSPEDEEEYYLKDFASTYDSLHSDQLQAQTKPKLVQDVLALEKRVESMQKEMSELKSRLQVGGEDKVTLFKSEITKLSEENNRLRAENECLRRKCISEPVADPVSDDSSSSVDSESDSNSSTGSSSSHDDEDEPPGPHPPDCHADEAPAEAAAAGAAEQ